MVAASMTRHFLLLSVVAGAAADATGATTAPASAVVFVKQSESGVAQLLRELEVRSDPESDSFMSWLTQAEVSALLEPMPEDLAAVRALAAAHGAVDVRPVGGSDKLEIVFAGSVPELFVSASRRHKAVDFVSMLGSSGAFDVRLRRAQRQTVAPPMYRRGNVSADPQSCLASLEGVTPPCLRKAYGLDSSTVQRDQASLGGQAFIVNQAFKASDLAQFQHEYGLPSNPVAKVVGKNSGSAGDEASLDSQYITTTGEGIETTFVYLDGSADNPFTNWLVWAANASDSALPKVHSLSLGAPENEVGDSIIGRMNTEMAALGSRGVTILFASGDSGYQPVQKYGAASPYVTAVGGIFNGELRDSVLQADSLTTGGFASNKLNKAQSWQSAAIASYTKNRKPGSLPATIDPTRRAVPDVSAYDDDISIIQNGGDTALSGTSAACPIVAGMLAKINEALAAAGHKTSLGFANPFLYANADAFLDITKGDNRGISAVKGYDPISGVGTFSPSTFEQLKAAALKAADRVRRHL